MNGTSKSANYKIQKTCRFKKDLWAAVLQAECFTSMCVTPIAFSTTCSLVHVVEKAIGVTHIEMKHPACCTAAQKSFLNLQDFCIFNIDDFEGETVCVGFLKMRKRRVHTHTHTHTHTRTHARTHARTQSHTSFVFLWPTVTHRRTHTHARARTPLHPQALIQYAFCFRVGSCWVFIANTFSHHTSSALQHWLLVWWEKSINMLFILAYM